MKLRIRGNSLRLRLTQSEVQAMGEVGQVEEKIEFPTSEPLVYRLQKTKAGNPITAAFKDGNITVLVPGDTIDHWVNTDEVGMETHHPLNDENSLRILIEKDFACLKPREDEDDSDAFSNPESHC